MKFELLKNTNIKYGGKASGLAHLIQSGINVPKGIAIAPENLLSFLSSKTSSFLEEITCFFEKSDKLAVRSSALSEDGLHLSFAGQYKSVLNVSNDISSLRNALEIVYNSSLSEEIQKYSGNNQDQMGIVIQKMVNAQYAGVLFTDATDLNGEQCCLLEFVEGLGDKLVSGQSDSTRIVIPYLAHKKLDLKSSRIEGALLETNVLESLIDSINKINKIYESGMDIEWCVDYENIAYIVQARPITKHILIPEINKGLGVIASIGSCEGKTYCIDSDLDDDKLLESINNFPEGAILVAPYTDTQYMPAINKAIGIITEEGSILSHAAIISREKELPCIVAFKNASLLFPTGTFVALNTASRQIISENFSSNFEDSEIDWKSLYIFENKVEEVIISGCKIIVERSHLNEKEIATHIPYEVTNNQLNDIEYYIRKKYHQTANFIASEKYLWFDEVLRFENFDIYRKYFKLAKELCENQSIVRLQNIYNEILLEAKKLVVKKTKATDDWVLFKLEETLAALHFIVDSIIPDGYGLLSVYKTINAKNISLRRFIEGDFNKSDNSLINTYNFFNDLSNFGNSICQSFVDLGAYSFSYFDDREERALKAIGGDAASSGSVSLFYDKLKTETKS